MLNLDMMPVAALWTPSQRFTVRPTVSQLPMAEIQEANEGAMKIICNHWCNHCGSRCESCFATKVKRDDVHTE